MFPFAEVAVVLGAYLLGCFTAGYYLVRWMANEDIHKIGSGNAGARNAGRILGSGGFIATLILDIAKGAVVVWAARFFGVGPYWLVFAATAVVAGHIWPLQFRFCGGKGMATMIGVMLVLDPLILGLVIGQFLCIYPFNRSFTISGLTAVAATPVTMLILRDPLAYHFGIAALAVMVLFAHRENLADRLRSSKAD
ncbi:MAG TPA: glycerol-3-phosphate acyltransferase [Bacillales bacterium]|nr:glycerol-3-phosphate acyltransferase [Bacillales bacterium]